MNRYIVKNSTLCFAFEKDHERLVNIWCPLSVNKHVKDVKKRIYKASDLYTKTNAKGERQYGRHAGLESTKELCDVDLVKFTPSTLAEAQKVIEGIKIVS